MCVNSEPPKQKTIFLIRHGESKWNKAQDSLNIGGLLDRDHALTEVGVQQAADLNQRWNAISRTEQLKALRISEDWEAYSTSPQPSAQPATATTDMFGDIPILEEQDHPTQCLLDLDFEEEIIPIQLQPQPQAIAELNRDSISEPIRDSNPNFNLNSSDNSNTGAHSSLSFKQDSYDDEMTQRPSLLSRFSSSVKNVAMSASFRIDPNNDRIAHRQLSPLPSNNNRIKTINQDTINDDFGLNPNKVISFEISVPISIANSPSNSTTVEPLDSTSNSPTVASDQLEFHQALRKPSRTRSMISRSTRFNGLEAQIEERRTEYIHTFLAADFIYSSPLTRAVETAFVALEGHPAVERGLTLYRFFVFNSQFL